jgi:catechol 2,3-dioxygenase-like lactoylglutathione lyase family enzyme
MTVLPSSPSFTTGHIGLNVSDIERSKQFYRGLFDFDLLGESQEEGRRYAFLARGGVLVLTLWQQSNGRFPSDRPGLHHLSFQVENIDAVRAFEARLRALGTNPLYEGVVPHSEGATSGGIFFTDPDGIRLEIFSPSGADEQPAPVSGAPTCGFF